MEFKGTKGIWQHCGSNGCKTIFVKGSKGQRRKEICDTVGRGEIEDLANAQLISKAPEMLEMLKELVSCSEDGYISAYEGGYEEWEAEFAEKLSKAKKLINEATNI